MPAKIIKTVVRPSLDHMFFKEWRSGGIIEFDGPMASDTEWIESITIEEIKQRQHELRSDLRAQIFGPNGTTVYPNFAHPIVNPFSLTDTKIKTFATELEMRNSSWTTKNISRFTERIADIRRLENTITLQFFVDNKLVETVEFK
jgi:hypothetical protein